MSIWYPAWLIRWSYRSKTRSSTTSCTIWQLLKSAIAWHVSCTITCPKDWAILKIKSSITEDLLTGGQIDKAKESLRELKKVSELLYIDVREQIFNLRTVVQERMGFFSTLQEYLSDYRSHYGLRVDLVIENECLTEFSPQVSGQLLRIIQEALTNVRKHSAAGKVLLRCSQGGDQMCVHIEDDGQGFHHSEEIEENGQHFGLQIMKERAESVGGSLVLDSKPGEGTRVVVCVPVEMVWMMGE